MKKIERISVPIVMETIVTNLSPGAHIHVGKKLIGRRVLVVTTEGDYAKSKHVREAGKSAHVVMPKEMLDRSVIVALDGICGKCNHDRHLTTRCIYCGCKGEHISRYVRIGDKRIPLAGGMNAAVVDNVILCAYVLEKKK